MASVTDILLGAAAEDGTGDGLRDGGLKINANTAAVNVDLEAAVTLLGMAAGSTDLGTFAGMLINDGQTVKDALQQLETTIETINELSAAYVPDGSGPPAVADALETAVAKLHFLVDQLNEAQRFAGTFDATVGTFPATANGGPSSGLAVEAGFVFQGVTVGTVDGIDFDSTDRLLALVDNPSTTTYAGNWARLQGGIDISTALPQRAIDGVGDAGATGQGSDAGHVHAFDVIPEIVTGTQATEADAATGSGARRLLLLEAGAVLDITVPAGESLNGVVDGAQQFKTPNTAVWLIDAGPGNTKAIADSSLLGTQARKYVPGGVTIGSAAWTLLELGVGPLDQFEGRLVVETTHGQISIECPMDLAPGKVYHNGDFVPGTLHTARASVFAGGTAIQVAAGSDNTAVGATGTLTGVYVYEPQQRAIPAADVVITNAAFAGATLTGNADGSATWV